MGNQTELIFDWRLTIDAIAVFLLVNRKSQIVNFTCEFIRRRIKPAYCHLAGTKSVPRAAPRGFASITAHQNRRPDAPQFFVERLPRPRQRSNFERGGD